jgi:hypothetical protein
MLARDRIELLLDEVRKWIGEGLKKESKKTEEKKW